MIILFKIYFVVTQMIYILTLPTWFRWAVLAYVVLESVPTFDIVLWILFLPMVGYPILVVGCATYSWKNHIYKPIRSFIMNLVPMLWIIASWILLLEIPS